MSKSMNDSKFRILLPALGLFLTGCGAGSYEFDERWHISHERVAEEAPAVPEGVPDLVASPAALPDLAYEGSADIFDVVVDQVDVKIVLNNLADQARVNLDIDPAVNGVITLNAYGQTLDQILARIQSQIALRYERVGGTLVVMNDEHYFKQYVVNYPAITRSFNSSASSGLTTTAGSSGNSAVLTSQFGSGSLWINLQAAIDAVLEVDYQFSREVPVADEEQGPLSASELAGLETIISSDPFAVTMPDSGLIVVYANSALQKIVSGIVSQVSSASVRQVLLEATVVEIQLSNQYRQGVEWGLFNPNEQNASNLGFQILQAGNSAAGTVLTNTEGGLVASATGLTTGGFINGLFSSGTVQAAVSFLDKFGDTRVVSSPRVSTLNGQVALLQVVRDEVFFEIKVEVSQAIAAPGQGETVSSPFVAETVTATTLPIGFSMTVFPQISADGTVILTVRPSITRLVRVARSPVTSSGTSLQVPVTSVKEIESIILLNDGQTAVLGGLIEDRSGDEESGIPGLGRIPGLGNLFKKQDQTTNRFEYVIFVSARVIKNPSLHGDYSDFQELLPSDETLARDKSASFAGGGRTRSVPRSN